MAVPAVAKVPEDPASSKEAQWITVKTAVLPVLSKDGKYFVARGPSSGLKMGRPVKVVGPEREGGERPVLGFATPIKVMPRRVFLELDAEAVSATQARFLVPPEPMAVAPPAPPAPVTPPEPPAPVQETAKLEPAPPVPAATPRTLRGGVKRSSLLGLGAIDKSLVIRNAEDAFWWKCKATLAGRRQAVLRGGVPSKGEKKVDQDDFKLRTDAPVVEKNQLLLECDEGTATFPIQG